MNVSWKIKDKNCPWGIMNMHEEQNKTILVF